MDDTDEPDVPVTEGQAKFVEEKTRLAFDYVIECMDRVRAEGNTVLQWFFGIITGGIAAIGALVTANYIPLAVGFGAAVGTAAYAADRLVFGLRTRETYPPGNYAASLNTMIGESEHRMRWREANGMDARIEANRQVVIELSTVVDNARIRLTRIPIWFLASTALAYFAGFCFVSPG